MQIGPAVNFARNLANKETNKERKIHTKKSIETGDGVLLIYTRPLQQVIVDSREPIDVVAG